MGRLPQTQFHKVFLADQEGNTLVVAPRGDAVGFRDSDVSGELKTLCGPFALDETGGQTGELTPLGQLEFDDHGHVKFISIYPHETATGKPVYPHP